MKKAKYCRAQDWAALHTGPDMKKIRVNKHSELQWSPPLLVHWRGFCLETSLDLLVCSACVYLRVQREAKPDKAENVEKKKLVNKLVGHCSIIFPSACVQSSPSFNLHSPADNADSLAPSCSACRYDLYQMLSLFFLSFCLSHTHERTYRGRAELSQRTHEPCLASEEIRPSSSHK